MDFPAKNFQKTRIPVKTGKVTCLLSFGWQYFVKKFQTKGLLYESNNTEIVVAYCNVVTTYIVENIYILVAYNGNIFPDGNYLFNDNNRNPTPRCETCSKSIKKPAEQCQ